MYASKVRPGDGQKSPGDMRVVMPEGGVSEKIKVKQTNFVDIKNMNAICRTNTKWKIHKTSLMLV